MAEESCASLQGLRKGTVAAQLDFLAAAQSTSYPNKQQDVTQDAREAEVYR